MAQDKIKPAPLTDAIQSAKLSDMIKFFGPGAIIVSLTIGSGEIPRIPGYAPWIFEKYPEVATRPPWVEVTVYIGAIGGGTYDYIGYIGMLREKNWGLLGLPSLSQLQQRIYELEEKGERIPLSEEEEDVRIALAWTKAPAIDSVVSFASVILFASGFMIGGARLLHSEQLVPSGLKLLEYQAQFLTRIHLGCCHSTTWESSWRSQERYTQVTKSSRGLRRNACAPSFPDFERLP